MREIGTKYLWPGEAIGRRVAARRPLGFLTKAMLLWAAEIAGIALLAVGVAMFFLPGGAIVAGVYLLVAANSQ